MNIGQDQRALQGQFFDATRRLLDLPMRTRGFGNIQYSPDHGSGEAAVLYEIDPEEFARRFPTMKEDWGTDVAPCIDIWVALDTRTGELDRHLGDLFGLDEWLRLSGRDAQADLIWDTDADITERVEALAEALTAYFA